MVKGKIQKEKSLIIPTRLKLFSQRRKFLLKQTLELGILTGLDVLLVLVTKKKELLVASSLSSLQSFQDKYFSAPKIKEHFGIDQYDMLSSNALMDELSEDFLKKNKETKKPRKKKIKKLSSQKKTKDKVDTSESFFSLPFCNKSYDEKNYSIISNPGTFYQESNANGQPVENTEKEEKLTIKIEKNPVSNNEVQQNIKPSKITKNDGFLSPLAPKTFKIKLSMKRLFGDGIPIIKDAQRYHVGSDASKNEYNMNYSKRENEAISLKKYTHFIQEIPNNELINSNYFEAPERHQNCNKNLNEYGNNIYDISGNYSSNQMKNGYESHIFESPHQNTGHFIFNYDNKHYHNEEYQRMHNNINPNSLHYSKFHYYHEK